MPSIHSPHPRRIEIERAILAAIDFLYGSQLAYGEFRTIAAGDEAMSEDCHFDSSPFATTFVLYSIGFFREARVQEMTRRALKFLRVEMEGKGVWRYWSSRNALHDVLPPDLDDISCISFILGQHRQSLANRDLLLANRSRDGLFYTWLAPRAETAPEQLNEIRRAAHASGLAIFSITGTLENIDCVVNANVVLYLGECEETRLSIDYLKQSVSEAKTCGNNYADPFALYYCLSRAYFNGVYSLEETRGAVMRSIAARQVRDGSFGNELLTALAMCTWLNFNQRPPSAVDGAIDYLLQTQRPSGAWKQTPMWVGPSYYGSEELTTALCVEALSRYNQ